MNALLPLFGMTLFMASLLWAVLRKAPDFS